MTTDNAPLPGLDLLLSSCPLPPTATPFLKLILPVHWSIIRANNRLIVEGSSEETTELLPPNWHEDLKADDWNKYVLLTYKNQLTNAEIEIKIIELTENVKVAISRRNGEAAIVRINEYVGGEETNGYQNLGTLEANVRKLFSENEKKTVQLPPRYDPYASKLSKEQLDKLEESRLRRKETESNPLRIPSRIPPDPFSVGRSDLDPFGGMNSNNGMLMDPRGFRNPRGLLPGGVNPPRFDPFGPMVGGFGSGSIPFGGPGGPNIPFGAPDNDLEHMPRGCDDMFM